MVEDCNVGVSESHPKDTEFYEKANEYWSSVDPTVNGVLGGFGYISSVDIKGSENFLKQIFKGSNAPRKSRALDCGAGIGRISKGLLVRYFESVDLVEQNSALILKARQLLSNVPNVKSFFECGLQNFEPSENYDIIWCQWVLGHLTDNDLVEFLKRCSAKLNTNGIIVVKENISSEGVIQDDADSSVTRPIEDYKKIFRQAELKVTRQATQTNFPSRLFAVKLFALQKCNERCNNT